MTPLWPCVGSVCFVNWTHLFQECWLSSINQFAFYFAKKHKYKNCKLNSPQYNALDDLWPPFVTLFGFFHLGNRAKWVQEWLLILISLVAPYAPKVPTLLKKYLWNHLSIEKGSHFRLCIDKITNFLLHLNYVCIVIDFYVENSRLWKSLHSLLWHWRFYWTFIK